MSAFGLQIGTTETEVRRFDGTRASTATETLAIEEPLEIRLMFGPADARNAQSISITMRTPGNDAELAAGFLLTEGIIRDADDVNSIATQGSSETQGNVVYVDLIPEAQINIGSLQRNFYTTSSCGICGKASLLALRTVSPPRTTNTFEISAEVAYQLPRRLRDVQDVFQRTGGLHAAALFDSNGALDFVREDVGRHNAVDKLIGAALLLDRVPLHDRLLLLSGRASFELLQKALMAGIPMVASVGAPSSLALKIASEFGITLIGFLRDGHFNVYHGSQRIRS